jgi:Uma2 family endonuclease
MAASVVALVSEEEFLKGGGKPNREYLDGVVRPKPMGTRKHGLLQRWLSQILDREREFESAVEVRVKVRPGKWLVPDIIVQRRDQIQDPYPLNPVHLCVEILSPHDGLAEAVAKAEDYAAWGVPTTWIVDGDSKRAWKYTRDGGLESVISMLEAGGIQVSLAELFSVL